MISKQKAISVLEAIRDSYMGFFVGSIVTKCIKAIQDIPEEDEEWISVTDRIPEEYVSVLVYIPGESPLPTVKEAFRVGNRFISSHFDCYSETEVIKWRHMPKPPKEEK